MGNLFKSNTVVGMLVAVVGWLCSPQVLATIHNSTVAALIQAVGAVWFAVGLRRAVAKAALGEPK